MWDEEEYILRRPILHDEEEDKWYDEFTGHEIVLDGDYWWDTVDEEYLVDTEESDIFVFEKEQKEIAFEESMSEPAYTERFPGFDMGGVECEGCVREGHEGFEIRFYPKENVYRCPRCGSEYSREEYIKEIIAAVYAVDECFTCDKNYPVCSDTCSIWKMKRLFSK